MKSCKQVMNMLRQAAEHLESIDKEIARYRVQIDELERIKAVLEKLPKPASAGTVQASHSSGDSARSRNVGSTIHRGKSREEIKAEVKATREAVLRAVATMGPSRPREIAEKCGAPLSRVENILWHGDWFQSEVDGWHLTSDGQLAWNQLRESQLETAS